MILTDWPPISAVAPRSGNLRSEADQEPSGICHCMMVEFTPFAVMFKTAMLRGGEFHPQCI